MEWVSPSLAPVIRNLGDFNNHHPVLQSPHSYPGTNRTATRRIEAAMKRLIVAVILVLTASAARAQLASVTDHVSTPSGSVTTGVKSV